MLHKYEHSVVAEIVSYDKDRYCGMCQFLEGLSATEANWSLARYIFNTYLDARGWRMLKVRFAVFVDKESAQLLNNNVLTCRVFGFTGYIDSALQFVLTNPSPSNIASAGNPGVGLHNQPQLSHGGVPYGSTGSPQSALTGQKSFNFMNVPQGHSNSAGAGSGPINTFGSQTHSGMAHGAQEPNFASFASRSGTPPSGTVDNHYGAHHFGSPGQSHVPVLPFHSLSSPHSSGSNSNSAHNQFFGQQGPDAYYGPVTGSVLLTDKDAVGFYLAFESAFCAYILRVFSVTVQESNPDSMTNSPTPLQLLNLPPTPHNMNVLPGTPSKTALMGANNVAGKTNGPMRISFFGHNPKDVKSASLYLEKLNSSNMRSHQVFFPKVDASKYKELNSYKTQHEGVLRVIRSRALADVAPELASGSISGLGSGLNSLMSPGSGPASSNKSRTRSLSSTESKKEDDGTSSNATGVGSRSPANSENDFVKFSVADGVDIVDPLLSKGYINITIKPPLHSRGLKYVEHYILFL
jgi:hypothetical protein